MSLFRSTASATMWNVVGQVAPGLVALAAVPVLVRGLGAERFGVLSLAWALIGYLSLFDLGLGRAVTRFAADALAARDDRRFAAVVGTGWTVLLVVGVLAGAATAAAAGIIGTDALRFSSEAIAAESRAAFYALAVAIPAVVLTAGLRGVLEAGGHFREANVIRIPLGMLAFVGPVLILPFTRHIAWHVAAVAVARLLGVVAYAITCLRVHPTLARRPSADRALLREMLSFGMWITVSSVVSPLMVTMDRFIIGASISVDAVTHYSAPFELASRLLILPAALSAVAFTVFARSGAATATATAATATLHRTSMRVIAAVLLPVLVTGIVLSRELLGVWLGPALAQQAAPSLRWLLVGVLFNALAHIPYARLQGEGAADLTAKAHLVELPIYAVLLAVLLREFGVVGAAMAWSARVTLDFAILDVAAQRRGAPSAHGATLLGGATVLIALALATSPSLALRGGLVAITALGAAGALWALGARERFTSILGARAGAGGRA